MAAETPEFWLQWEARGCVHQTTNPTLGAWMAAEAAAGRLTAYCGFDPTADSLHVGGLLPVLGLRRLMAMGGKPIALVGGATGMIGDPSGKSAERVLLDADAIRHNADALGRQLEHLLQAEAGKDFLLANNMDWIGPLLLVDFLRDIGKHFSVNMMIAKDSVRARLENREQGISYTEFSYMLLQAYDFWHLHEAFGCKLQVGGSDQWGNITAGIELIRHRRPGAEAYGMTFPLLTNSDGKKFGKSERGNIWLDRRRTHPYFFYKYFFHRDDADVPRLLRLLTLLPWEEVQQLEAESAAAPHRRSGQRALARTVTAFVHGAETAAACAGLEDAMHREDGDAFEVHAAALGLLDPAALDGQDIEDAALPVAHRPLALLAGEGVLLADLAVELGLYQSKSDLRRDLQAGNGAFQVAGQPVATLDSRLTTADLGNRRVVLVRRGKKQKRMLCFHE